MVRPIMNKNYTVTKMRAAWVAYSPVPEKGLRVQPPVTFPIGDHVNVLHDYKKTGPSTILKLLTCRCHHLIDMLTEFSQSLVLVTDCQHVLPACQCAWLKCSYVRLYDFF